MVKINANLDLKTNEVVKTGRLNDLLSDLSEEELGITVVARDGFFINAAWQDGNKSYLRLVLPYEEVLSSKNVDLFIAKALYFHLDKLQWMDFVKMKKRLEDKFDLGIES